MVSLTVQTPWSLLTRISDATKTLCLSCCQYKKNPMCIQNQLPSSAEKLSEKQAQRLANPPNASLAQAGSLSPGQGNSACKEGSRDQAGVQLGHPSSSGRLRGPRDIKNNSHTVLLQVQGLDNSTSAACPSRGCSVPKPSRAAGDTRHIPSSSPAAPQTWSQQGRAFAELVNVPETAAGDRHCQRDKTTQHCTVFSSSKSLKMLRN